MAWLRIDDRVRTHPKIAQAGPAAAWLWFCGICYCREHLTNGFIPKPVVSTLALNLPSPWRHAAKLVEVRLWEDALGGYLVHDFLDWNPSKEEVLSLRDRSRDKKRTQRGQTEGQTEGHIGDTRERAYAGAGDAGLGSVSPRSGSGFSEEDTDAPLSAEPPVMRSMRARRALTSDADYHTRNCPRWAVRACEWGFCIPKYLWPQWEQRRGPEVTEAWLNSLRMFVEQVMERTPPGAGDRAEQFWPAHFEAHFGTSAPTPTGGRLTAVQTTLATLRGGSRG